MWEVADEEISLISQGDDQRDSVNFYRARHLRKSEARISQNRGLKPHDAPKLYPQDGTSIFSALGVPSVIGAGEGW